MAELAAQEVQRRSRQPWPPVTRASDAPPRAEMEALICKGPRGRASGEDGLPAEHLAIDPGARR
eukprot:2781205-Lingulodinium_polyedra.AAC.1